MLLTTEPLVFEECDCAEGFCFLTSHTGDWQFPVTIATTDCSIQVCGFSSKSVCHDFMVNRHLTACKRPLQLAFWGLCWRWQALEMQTQTPFEVPFKANAECCLLFEVSGPLVAMSFNEELELLHYPQSGTSPECWKRFCAGVRCYNKVKSGCKTAWV